MPDKKDIPDIVMAFARSCARVTPPGDRNEPVVPTFNAMTEAVFDEVHQGLGKALGDKGFVTTLPVQGLKECDTWTQVCILVASRV